MNNNILEDAIEILLRKPKVLERTSLTHSTLYYLMSKGDFPMPVKLGSRIVAWKKSEIDEWINTRQRTNQTSD